RGERAAAQGGHGTVAGVVVVESEVENGGGPVRGLVANRHGNLDGFPGDGTPGSKGGSGDDQVIAAARGSEGLLVVGEFLRHGGGIGVGEGGFGQDDRFTRGESLGRGNRLRDDRFGAGGAVGGGLTDGFGKGGGNGRGGGTGAIRARGAHTGNGEGVRRWRHGRRRLRCGGG